jgi:hypothetical protein
MDTLALTRVPFSISLPTVQGSLTWLARSEVVRRYGLLASSEAIAGRDWQPLTGNLEPLPQGQVLAGPPIVLVSNLHA